MPRDGDDRRVPDPPSPWQKKVLAASLGLPGRARTELQRRAIRVTRAWRKATGWKPPKPKPDPIVVKRQAIVDWCMAMHNQYEGRLGYSQSRPKWFIRDKPPKMTKPSYADCSSLAIRAYQIAGAPSPSRYGYSGYGSTYDEEPHGRRVFDADLVPSDLVFYRGHVGVYVGNGMVVSHGSSVGPRLHSLNYRSDRTSNRRYFG